MVVRLQRPRLAVTPAALSSQVSAGEPRYLLKGKLWTFFFGGDVFAFCILMSSVSSSSSCLFPKPHAVTSFEQVRSETYQSDSRTTSDKKEAATYESDNNVQVGSVVVLVQLLMLRCVAEFFVFFNCVCTSICICRRTRKHCSTFARNAS